MNATGIGTMPDIVAERSAWISDKGSASGISAISALIAGTRGNQIIIQVINKPHYLLAGDYRAIIQGDCWRRTGLRQRYIVRKNNLMPIRKLHNQIGGMVRTLDEFQVLELRQTGYMQLQNPVLCHHFNCTSLAILRHLDNLH